jgi:photosystem II stability/assembly factor-like uncharacterized protein
MKPPRDTLLALLGLALLLAVVFVFVSTHPTHPVTAATGGALPAVSNPRSAAAATAEPSITKLEPVMGPNDLDLQVTISGTGFLSTTTVALGKTQLSNVTLHEAGYLTALVPWGMEVGLYGLVVTNPEHGTMPAVLEAAYTVTPGIGVLNEGELYGGFVDQLGLDPQQPSSIYAALNTLGLYASRDAGATWSFKLPAASATNLTVDPVNLGRLFLYADWDFVRSDDGGDTWVKLEVDFPNHPESPNSCGSNRIYVHPTQPNVLYAGSCGHHGGAGLLRSIDDGATWSSLMDGLTDPYVTSLAFHPADPDKMVTGTSDGRIFMSEDGGGVWIELAQPIGYISDLVFNPVDPHELWAASGAFARNLSFPPARSTNAAYTEWESVDITEPDEGVFTVAFSPASPETIYVIATFGGYRSIDNGQTWTTFESSTDIALHPSDARIAYIASATGVRKTTDGGNNWSDSNHGLTGMMPRHLAPVPGQPGDLYASIHAGDGAIWHATRGGANWRRIPITDTHCTGPTVVNPAISSSLYVAGLGQVCMSDDSGETWTVVEVKLPPGYPDCDRMLPSALKGHPTDTETLLLGGRVMCGDNTTDPGLIFVSQDDGLTWEAATINNPGLVSIVTDFAFDPVYPDIAYAATEGSGLLKSTDRGITWLPMGRDHVGLNDVISLAMQQHEPYLLYAAGRGGWPHFYSSQNQGQTWTEFPPDDHLAEGTGIHIYQILVTPDPSSTLYAATPRGLKRSTDGGATWHNAASSLGYVSVGSVAVAVTEDRSILYVGTTGGYVDVEAYASTRTLSTLDGIVSPGMYRFTSRLQERQVFLPLVLRAQETGAPAAER